ncbi:2'-5' RNA ligase family protein [Nisaea nitritireducens]|uniref:2'-5' RNA ligase family protein n=1 Tax=Nisaea nitritireducens TaxID=568392 RepID=UPI00186907A2|nr:2'-5' RNA ligase family protein [Nisaea nitritireducens]
MAHAISLSSNNVSADRVRQLWRDFGSLENAPTMSGLDYPPHITFAVWDESNTSTAEGLIRSVFGGMSPIRLTFDRIRWFDTDPLVIWAAPSSPEELFAFHVALHRQRYFQSCRAHYRPESWVPHCTLAMDVAADNRQQAIELASRPITPFDVVFDAVDWVSFPPVDLKYRLGCGV